MPLAERALIAEIQRMAGGRRRRLAGSGARIIAGIGDDCAVLRLPRGTDSLVTTDFSLEGIHFRRDWHPAESVGHRCLTRGLSDIAAMGGEPVAVFLSLALPRDVPQPWVRGFMRGLINLAKKYGATLAGGDTAELPNGILADIIVVGAVPKGKAILRSGARPGDRIYVSGALGGSAAGVLEMRDHPGKKLSARNYPRHFYPEPRIELGRILREKRLASSMIDTSDGLSTDLSHICDESGVGAELDSAKSPLARVGKPARVVDLGVALHGGEDYELLFTVPEGKRLPPQIAGVTVRQIGHITRTRTMLIRDEKGDARKLVIRGWEHFRK
jgi:thiamine-monophosphate kinase